VEGDLPLLAEWLARPHVMEWWRTYPSLEAVREHYLPRVRGESVVTPYLALLQDDAVGYIQSYVAADVGDDWWPDVHDRSVWGMDQFLADGRRLGQGLGTRMLRAFVDLLFRDPRVKRIQVDPAVDNRRAIRCYEKAGFQAVGPVTTTDGPALLMVVSRP
jgi:aminoglycoside 6'-N-acetyltransferase-1b